MTDLTTKSYSHVGQILGQPYDTSRHQKITRW